MTRLSSLEVVSALPLVVEADLEELFIRSIFSVITISITKNKQSESESESLFRKGDVLQNKV